MRPEGENLRAALCSTFWKLFLAGAIILLKDMDILDGLNPAQLQAVEAIEGPLLILAGPGSGKTRVITHRVAYLIRKCGINPRHIMAVTFTNKAANEMKERLQTLLGLAAQELTVGTFHAICARILRRDGAEIGLDSHFVIYDEEDQQNLVKQILQELDLDPKKFVPRAVLSAISNAKSHLLTPQDYAKQRRSYFDEVVQRVYERYEERLRQSKALDFDDLLMKTVQLFQEREKVLAKYQKRYLHLLIDEFQDTNVAQYMLAKQLAAKHHNICVVGDPDQSIYSWRAADLRNILNFEKDYPDAKVVLLEQNYRSTQTILETASGIISSNRQRKRKRLWTENEAGDKVIVFEAYNEQEEALFVVSEVERLAKQGIARLQDCAVMYRTNAQSRALEEAFIRYGLPYRLVGATRFYARREIKDVIAYLKLIHNPYDTISLSRIINVPPRNIGQRSLEQLSRWAQALGVPLYSAMQVLANQEASSETTSPPKHPFNPRMAKSLLSFLSLHNELMEENHKLGLVELLDETLKRTGYREYVLAEEDGEDRWDNILELRTVASQYEDLPPQEALTTFLEGVALVSDIDDYDAKANAATLITLHQAKGLEFPVVFIVGLEEGVLPHRRSFDDPAQMEEERRLCYVGVTRAKKRLYLVRAFRRSLMGASMANDPSRFLEDIPDHLVASPQPAGANAKTPVYHASPATPPPLAEPAFKAGEQVRHAQFGQGIVINCQPISDDQEVTIAFKGAAGLKRLLMSLANLERT